MAEETVLGVVLEALVLFLRLIWESLKSVFRAFVPPKAKDVTGQIVLITGAGHGMGREMALRFAKLDAVVVCVDINAKGNEETLTMIKKMNKKAYRFECDVSSRAACLELADKVMKEVGDVNILVNNAGIMPTKPLVRQTEKDIKSTMDINVLGVLWMIQAFLPRMIRNNNGHLVSMSSMVGITGVPNLVPYSGSKYAVRGIMEALGLELRDYDGIKLTTICPYMVDTGLCKKVTYRWEHMAMVKPGDAADMIVNAVRREYIEVTIPYMYHTIIRYYFKLLPMAMSKHFIAFFKTNLHPEDELF